jgi:UDP-N-acetylmuramoylalanine--D-glutamate ligase
MKHYVRAKRALIDYQGPEGVIVMSLDNDMTRTIGYQYRAKVRWFSLEAQMPNGASIAGKDLILLDQNDMPHFLATRQEIKLRGPHNLSNILAACLMAREAGVSIEAMREVITTFTGVEHRLELVRERAGVSYFNDSVSTTPARLIAALHSYHEPIVLLAGGRDKNLPWEDAARLILHKTRLVILFGEATELIAKAIEKVRHEIATTHTIVHRCANLEEAVNLAAQLAQPGDVVLLSPGCASFDAFHDYTERGKRFKALVQKL